jgi:hypothetical protein
MAEIPQTSRHVSISGHQRSQPFIRCHDPKLFGVRQTVEMSYLLVFTRFQTPFLESR